MLKAIATVQKEKSVEGGIDTYTCLHFSFGNKIFLLKRQQSPFQEKNLSGFPFLGASSILGVRRGLIILSQEKTDLH